MVLTVKRKLNVENKDENPNPTKLQKNQSNEAVPAPSPANIAPEENKSDLNDLLGGYLSDEEE